MNHPIINRQAGSNRRIAPSGFITAALCGGLAVILLKPNTTEPVRNFPAEQLPRGQAETPKGAFAASAPDSINHVQSPGIIELKTVAEMNRLADTATPLEEKLASFASAMRSAHSHQAAEAARRSIFLIKSADYTRLAGPLLLDPTLSASAMQVLGLNVHDRDPAYTLPLLARVCAIPGHPLQADAADTLAFYLGESARTLTGESLQNAVKDWLAGPQISEQP